MLRRLLPMAPLIAIPGILLMIDQLAKLWEFSPFNQYLLFPALVIVLETLVILCCDRVASDVPAEQRRRQTDLPVDMEQGPLTWPVWEQEAGAVIDRRAA
ncbi:hypothetical protein MIB92_06320 [Aestuariirhabdus sp. Z084]|uniref:hypothetical protein n=1 Tax=Aestuariirhabdus haliotis TaxID=2918751 RepID=UPI00201B3628|nr:hypothetical protein [Aestuariirhabdus haliotis]MCL6415257.1 hypothetical protein [Aestuariirhabdus haliotis]MCL6419517.1 hypothetical protein [Aestuariirhabdus haliotis]